MRQSMLVALFVLSMILVQLANAAPVDQGTADEEPYPEITFDGYAYDEDGKWIPVSDCPYGCAIEDICGPKDQCKGN